jgi:hypothetical protein
LEHRSLSDWKYKGIWESFRGLETLVGCAVEERLLLLGFWREIN